MRRREFIALLSGALVWPIEGLAQQDRVRRVGVLRHAKTSDLNAQADMAVFEKTLQSLGWSVGRNVIIDQRWSEGVGERLQTFAKEFATSPPDVVFAVGTGPLAVLRREMHTGPIVFTRVSDPVGQGFVASLARPGGNITGFSNFELDMGGKWLETLTEVAPQIKRVAVIANPASSALDGYYRSVSAAAATLGVEATRVAVQDVRDVERALESASDKPNGGAIMPPDAMTISIRNIIVARAKKLRLPVIYPFRYFASEGGLISYGINALEQFRGAASYVDRILKGEKPGDLPVQSPSKFELVINLQTAKAIGLTVPSAMLVRADEVIE